jgi:hypothetical protein
MSTVELSLYEKVDYKEKPEAYSKTFGSKSKEGFKTGWGMIQNIAIAIIYIWPLILGLLIAFFFLRRRLRKQKSK